MSRTMHGAHDTALGCGAPLRAQRKAEDLAWLLRWAAATPHVPDVGQKCGIGGSLEASAAGEKLLGGGQCVASVSGGGANIRRLWSGHPWPQLAQHLCVLTIGIFCSPAPLPLNHTSSRSSRVTSRHFARTPLSLSPCVCAGNVGWAGVVVFHEAHSLQVTCGQRVGQVPGKRA